VIRGKESTGITQYISHKVQEGLNFSMVLLISYNHFHRIIECFGLEGTFRDHVAQPTSSEQGHLQLDQVA